MPVPKSPRSGHPRRRPGRLPVLVVGAASALLVFGCSEPEPDPAEVRQEVIRDRLEETFSGAQVDCIMSRLDDSVLQALDLSTDLDPEGDAMAAYTEAVTTCVTDPNAPPTATEPDDGATNGEDVPDEAPADEAPTDGSDGDDAGT